MNKQYHRESINEQPRHPQMERLPQKQVRILHFQSFCKWSVLVWPFILHAFIHIMWMNNPIDTHPYLLYSNRSEFCSRKGGWNVLPKDTTECELTQQGDELPQSVGWRGRIYPNQLFYWCKSNYPETLIFASAVFFNTSHSLSHYNTSWILKSLKIFNNSCTVRNTLWSFTLIENFSFWPDLTI